jgi:RHS repeat-associated protein
VPFSSDPCPPSETWYANAGATGSASAGSGATGSASALNTIQYARDSAGRITSESDNNSADSYTYDAAGDVTSATESLPDGPTVVLDYQYNAAGDRTETAATIDGTADFVDDYGYDSLGRVTSVHQHGVDGGDSVADVSADFTYNDSGQIVSIDRYQSGQLAVQGDYSYDSLGRLVGLVYHQGETVLNSYQWTYNSSGASTQIPNPQSLIPPSWTPSGGMMPIDDTSGVTAALMSGGLSGLDLIASCTSNDGTATYSYDPTGQLTGAVYSSPLPSGEGQGEGTQPDESYSYDPNGNRLTANGQTYTTGPNNELLSDGTYTYSFDAEGNRTARWIASTSDGLETQPGVGDTDITVYTWDNRNRLASVTHYADYAAFGASTPDMTATYLYDAENRWIGETVSTFANGSVSSIHSTEFAYDGTQIVLQFDSSSPLPPGEGQGEGAAGEGQGESSSGATGSASALTVADLSHRYLWNPAAVDKLLADEQVTDPQVPGNVVLPLTDNLGTPRDLAVYNAQTSITTVANHRVFDSYGNLKSQTNAAVDCLFGFTGVAFDKASGTYRSQTRPYDPVAGRWTCRDWIGFKGRDANRYRYCGCSPTNATDPTGRLDGGSLVLSGPGNITPAPNAPIPPPIPPAPNVAPGPGWKWQGPDERGGPKGGWKGPNGDSLHWDPGGNGERPHWDWNDPYGNKWKYFPDTGKWEADPGNKPNRPQPLFPPGTLETAEIVGGGIALGTAIYWIVSELSRLFPPRNALPIP